VNANVNVYLGVTASYLLKILVFQLKVLAGPFFMNVNAFSIYRTCRSSASTLPFYHSAIFCPGFSNLWHCGFKQQTSSSMNISREHLLVYSILTYSLFCDRTVPMAIMEAPYFGLSGFLKLVVRVPGTHALQLRTSTCHTSVVHRAHTPNDLLLLFIKDLLVMGNQYFWWASKI
jgi:hypothetical protein